MCLCVFEINCRCNSSVTVTFPLLSDPEVSFLAWTTTPWTLPSNLALCVHPEHTYVEVRVKETQKRFILMQALLPSVFPAKKVKGGASGSAAGKSDAPAAADLPYEVLRTMKGVELKDLQYEPLFPYFAHVELLRSRPSSHSS